MHWRACAGTTPCRVMETRSCASLPPSPSLQQSWQAYVVTTDPSSARAQRTASILRASGIEVVLTKAEKSASSSLYDKVKSHTQTSRNIFDTMSRQSGPADDYVLVFEDDIALTPGVTPEQVTGYLRCAAQLSLRASGGPLPLFYSGGCAPKFAANQSFWGRYSPTSPISGEIATVRMTCRCAHAYAVRRGDARVLYRLADEQPARGTIPKFYMDVQLDALSKERGGVFLLGADKTSPQDAFNRGLYLQDRKTFRSGIGRPRMLSFVTHSGWANQLVGLSHAIHLARKLDRGLVVPRALKLGDVLDDGGCFARPPQHVPDTRTMMSRYERFENRPMLDDFIDTSAWPMQAYSPKEASAWINTSTYIVPNMCSFQELSPRLINAGDNQYLPKLNQRSWQQDFWPLVNSTAAAAPAIMQLGSAFTLYPKANCDYCSIRYRPELLSGAARLLCTIQRFPCSEGEDGLPTFDAIHLRLIQPYPRAYDVNRTIRSALRGGVPAGPKGAAKAPPLWIASDSDQLALSLVHELNVGIGRRIISQRVVDSAQAARLLKQEASGSKEHALIRPLLLDALISVGARRFTPSAGTFSGHILGMRACASSGLSGRGRAKGSRHAHVDAHCTPLLRHYDYSANCPSFDSCDLPKTDYALAITRSQVGIRE